MWSHRGSAAITAVETPRDRRTWRQSTFSRLHGGCRLLRRHGGGGGATAVLVRCHGSHGGAAAEMAVPRRSH